MEANNLSNIKQNKKGLGKAAFMIIGLVIGMALASVLTYCLMNKDSKKASEKVEGTGYESPEKAVPFSSRRAFWSRSTPPVPSPEGESPRPRRQVPQGALVRPHPHRRSGQCPLRAAPVRFPRDPVPSCSPNSFCACHSC